MNILLKNTITITSLLCCMLTTGCSLASSTKVYAPPDDLPLTDIIDDSQTITEPSFDFGTIDTTDFSKITTDSYNFKYDSNLWNIISPYELQQKGESILDDTCVILENDNDVVQIICSDTTYLSNTSPREYFDLIITSIPNIPLTGVDIISTSYHQFNDLDIALIETKAGFTKEDIENLIYKQYITHENVNAIGGINFLDYKPILSQFVMIISQDNKAYTFLSSFENNPNSSYFNSYYKDIILQTYDSIVQTFNTTIKSFDK